MTWHTSEPPATSDMSECRVNQGDNTRWGKHILLHLSSICCPVTPPLETVSQSFSHQCMVGRSYESRCVVQGHITWKKTTRSTKYLKKIIEHDRNLFVQFHTLVANPPHVLYCLVSGCVHQGVVYCGLTGRTAYSSKTAINKLHWHTRPLINCFQVKMGGNSSNIPSVQLQMKRAKYSIIYP